MAQRAFRPSGERAERLPLRMRGAGSVGEPEGAAFKGFPARGARHGPC
jgi:hypothetical protein